MFSIYSFLNWFKYEGEWMNVLSKMFPGGQHVGVFRERKSDWNVLAAKTTMKEKLSAKLSNIASSKTMNNFVRFVDLLFFRSEGFSEEGCHVVTSKSNSEETVCSCNHLTHFAVLMDYDGSTKVIKLDLPYWIILWAWWINSILSFNFSFFDTAHRGGRNNSENYHLRGTEPFHRRDTFNINTLFLPHVSNVPEY